VWTVAFWGFLALAVWLLGKIRPTWEGGRRVTAWVAALAIAAFGWWFSFALMLDWQTSSASESRQIVEGTSISPDEIVARVARSDWNDHIPWQPWQLGLAEVLSRRGYTVYVDYTASWCPNCKVNKYLWLETDSMRSKMRELRVIPIEADFSDYNPVMHEEIKSWARPTVPLNLVYPAGRPGDAIKLPELFLSADPVHEALDKAGASREFPALPPAP
jgi:thiol:disulfide interchange protein